MYLSIIFISIVKDYLETFSKNWYESYLHCSVEYQKNMKFILCSTGNGCDTDDEY